MPSASATLAEAEFSGFVTCCGEPAGTISLVPFSCWPASIPSKVAAAPGGLMAQTRIPFEGE
jgi:hypothetical protein